MELDLTPILHNPKAAVHCSTYEQAEQFIKCIRGQGLRQCSDTMALNWKNYKEETCYSPYFGHPVKNYMTYCPVSHYVKNGFTIIEFEELARCTEELDIELSSESLDFLLGL